MKLTKTASSRTTISTTAMIVTTFLSIMRSAPFQSFSCRESHDSGHQQPRGGGAARVSNECWLALASPSGVWCVVPGAFDRGRLTNLPSTMRVARYHKPLHGASFGNVIRRGRELVAAAISAAFLLAACSTSAEEAPPPEAIQDVAQAPCSMANLNAIQALRACRGWVTYAPKDFGSVSERQLTADLTFLHTQGFRGLVTYDVAGALADAPRIAKSLGFEKVIAGIYDPAAGVVDQAAKVAGHADAVVVGNEGVSTGRYTYAELAGWVAAVKADPRTSGMQVTTSEPWILYLNQGQPWQYPQLLTLGDFAFPNFQPYFDADPQWHTDPANAARLVNDNWQTWFATAPNPVVLKESWWPSALSDPGNEGSAAEVCNATPSNQATYFTALKSYPGLYFVWGEAQDVPKDPEIVTWCTDSHKDPARHWGFWTSLKSGDAKPVAAVVDTGSY